VNTEEEFESKGFGSLYFFGVPLVSLSKEAVKQEPGDRVVGCCCCCSSKDAIIPFSLLFFLPGYNEEM